MDIVRPKKKCVLLPCGVDLSELQLTSKAVARTKMHLEQDKRYVLFAGAFDNAVKNAPLAKETVARIGDANVELLELNGYSREEVTLLMCSADVFLMTSVSEGSPQVIKEALACGCPIVSVDVGDVKERIDGVEGCFVAETHEPGELVELLRVALLFEGRTKGREKIMADGLDNHRIAEKLTEIYKKTIK
jgi:glycosyltransferase involved in cell wall biosynthesis